MRVGRTGWTGATVSRAGLWKFPAIAGKAVSDVAVAGSLEDARTFESDADG
jgi:hypothetical protein